VEPGTAARPGPTSSCGLKAVADTAGRMERRSLDYKYPNPFMFTIIHAMAFKRKRVYANRSNAFKKRKSSKRRNFKRKGGPKALGYTSLNTRDHVFGFRTKKTSHRAYRKHLWDSTLFSTHYRSIISNATTIATPANYTTGTLTGLNLDRLNGQPFWTVAGGAAATDFGVTPPLFKGDIVRRGGIYEMQFQNPSTTGDIRLRLWLIRSVTNPDFSFEPVGGLAPTIWDPTASPDFIKEIGKPMWAREVVIENGNSYTFKGRYKMQKIDEETYGSQGLCNILYIMACNVGHVTPTTINVLGSHNLSFSADAIGTT